VAFTAVFSLLGGLAPSLWLALARAGAFLAIGLAYRLAARLAGPVAGALAVMGLVFMPDWMSYFAGGTSELLLVALILWAVERHVEERRGQALALLFAAALLRPEAWPFLLVYAILYAARDRRRWLVAAPLLAAVPLLWFGPEWIGAGNPVHGATLARLSREARHTQMLRNPALEVLSQGVRLVLVPLWIGAMVGLVRAIRQRDRLPLILATGAFGWTAVVVAMTVVGYAGVPRFLLPAAAALCVLGAAEIGHAARELGASRPVLAGALLAVTCAPFLVPRTVGFVSQARTAETHDELQDQLGALLRGLGGTTTLRTCGPVLVEHQFRSALAWELGVPEASLAGSHPRLFLRRQGRVLRGFPPMRPGERPHLEEVAHSGQWSAVRVLRHAAGRRAAACAGHGSPGSRSRL
jgi:hypothetical protein